VIRSFKWAETAALARGERVKRLVNVAAVARRKLRQLEIADYHLGRGSMRRLEPVTPGELLLEEFLKPMGISRYRLAKEIGVPAQRIGEIVAGRRAISVDSDLRLCRFFGLSNGYWLRAQAAHDTEVAERILRAKLATIRPWTQKAGEKRRAASRS